MKSVGELIEGLEAENARLKIAASRQSRSDALLAATRQELADSIAAAEGQLASERLGGNVVKEHFWLGELAALRRMRVVVEANNRRDHRNDE